MSGKEKILAEEKSNLKGDYKNLGLLLWLYSLQGMISGLAMSVPILLQNRGAPYKEQALFSISYYPFSMKVLWSPIVDSVFITKFGRRKSWIVPFELLIGLSLIMSADRVNQWLSESSKSSPDVVSLTAIIFILITFSATHDIALDGWSLIMLKKKNVGHIATAEELGLTVGFFVAYTSLLVLESKEFCNSYIFKEPRDQGLITVGGYMKFWGAIFLVTAVLITFFKHEYSGDDKILKEHPNYSFKQAYPTLLKIIKLKPVIKLSIFLLTAKIAFGAVDSITLLRLVEYGVPKDKIALNALLILPIQILLSFLVSRYITGKHPLTFFMRAFQLRLLLMIIMCSYLHFTPQMIGDKSSIPAYYYIGIIAVYFLYQFPFKAMSIAGRAFYTRTSDPLVGGTYLTLLNTIHNFGHIWPQTFSLWLADIITWKRCVFNENFRQNSTTELSLFNNKCENNEAKIICQKNGGHCVTDVDGFYIEGVFYLIFGIIFYKIGIRIVKYLEQLPIEDWHILSKKKSENEEEVLNAENE